MNDAALTATGTAWSPLQQAVFDHVERDDGGNLVVEALAGSGKTSTIVEALRHCYEDESTLLVAFNKEIAEEFKRRNLPTGVTASTLHSYGLRQLTRAIGRREIDGYYTSGLIMQHLGRGRAAYDARRAASRLVSLAKSTLTVASAEALDELADDCGIEMPRQFDRWRIVEAAERVLVECEARLRSDAAGATIDFDDMIWGPVVLGAELQPFDRVFVDETQDLNPAQLAMLLRIGGRCVAVGDRRQAIYAFRGADRDAIPRIIRTLRADCLPLSITYRCPLAVVAEARKLVPELQAAPNAAEGSVRRGVPYSVLAAEAGPGDFVLSRTNAPLITLAYKWIAAGIPCSIRGRDIGKGLSDWVKRSGARTIAELRQSIDVWCDAECRRLVEADRDTEHVEEKAECLRAVIAEHVAVADVINHVEKLFDDRRYATDGIVLSSTHRAKGLEADRVWLLRDTYCKWPGDEESNLLYVAITRSKRELIYCYKDPEG